MESPRLFPLAVHDGITEEISMMPLSLADRGHTVGSVFSPWHCGIPRSVTADADAVVTRSLPQDRVNAWHVGFLTAVKRRNRREAQEERRARTPHDRRLSVWRGLYSWHDPDIVPRVAALRTGAMRHLPTL
ncbi:hypothetical protein TcCL_Unassigned01486 [Trypanosoma cruzi]|nr:hypothetical protein TcCL_Unassigned01486 [Trypanosoma cruzi]